MATASEQAPARLLVIACGALAHEIVWLQKLNGWAHLDLQCLDAELHNKPKLIASKLVAKIEQNPDGCRGTWQFLFDRFFG